MVLPDAVVWAIEDGPPVHKAMFVGELARKAVMSHVDPGRSVPWVLRGHGDSSPIHDHAFFLPDDSDGDGGIDRILITARGGFDTDAVAALVAVDRLYATVGSPPGAGGSDGGGDDVVRLDWPVRCVYLGGVSDAPSRLVGVSDIWWSAAPYVAALDARNVKQAIRREADLRFLPKPLEVAEVAEDGTERDADAVRPAEAGHWLRLRFGCRLGGPLALGRGCHYGLGVFVPRG